MGDWQTEVSGPSPAHRGALEAEIRDRPTDRGLPGLRR